MQTSKPVKVSKNCWKHTDQFGNVSYRKTSDPESELHREDGPAVEWANGDKVWWINDKRHRLDGPAIEWASGHKEWWINNKLHREDGPAIEYADGSKAWYYKDKFIDVNSQEEFEEYLKKHQTKIPQTQKMSLWNL